MCELYLSGTPTLCADNLSMNRFAFLFILLALFTLLVQPAFSQSTLYPIIRSEANATTTPGGQRTAWFEFVNNSKAPVTIQPWTTTGLSSFGPYTRDTIFPGDTARVTLIINTRGYKGAYEFNPVVKVSDGNTVTHRFSYYHLKQPGDTVKQESCNCEIGIPRFPGGQKVYTDSLLKLTKQTVQPTVSGTCVLHLHINANGIIDSVDVMTSVDPVFEAELLRHIQTPGNWKPLCSKTPEPGYENCRGLKPVASVLELDVRY